MKPFHIVALIAIAIAIAAIMLASNDYTTSENFISAFEKQGKSVQIVGFLAEDKPLEYDPLVDPNHFSFYMVDKEGTEKKVVLNAPKPQDFERSEQIVVTGSAQEDIFYASKILMKCPSKYVEDEVEIVEVTSNESS